MDFIANSFMFETFFQFLVCSVSLLSSSQQCCFCYLFTIYCDYLRSRRRNLAPLSGEKGLHCIQAIGLRV
ncbi:hypothetical protein P8452_11730 [Trifolium repens]|nr:hypothetical protein P8452_11730 [Trifolium repens]